MKKIRERVPDARTRISKSLGRFQFEGGLRIRQNKNSKSEAKAGPGLSDLGHCWHWTSAHNDESQKVWLGPNKYPLSQMSTDAQNPGLGYDLEVDIKLIQLWDKRCRIGNG